MDTDSNRDHCGGCDNACGENACEAGSCVLSCPGGQSACDGECVDTSSDVEHCGACGNACFDGQLCAEGACVCPGATEACSDECVDLSLDVRHCGSCNNACVERPNAEPPTCRDGGCVTICLEGYGDCDGLDENGCEASLSSLETCGSCTNDCTTLPNVAQASCDAGACGIVECVEGWLDCDGDAGNGCETEANLKDSCGACNTTCFACSESTCVGAKEVLTTQASTTCAILEDGSLWCWGNNQEKQIDDSAINPVVPTRIPLPQRAETLGGYIHHCAVLEDGTLACWGRNDSGQLGDGTLTSRSQPVVVPMLGGVVQVGGGFRHTCALTLQGEVYCWGQNWMGQIGAPPVGAGMPTPTLVLFP